jgi:GNAT superfamily N-acetyltransferase
MTALKSILILVVASSTFVINKVFAAETGPTCAAVLAQPSQPEFNPLEVFKKSGLDPNKFRFKADLSYQFKSDPTNEMQGMTWSIRIYYDGIEAGFINVGLGSIDPAYMWVAIVELKPEYQGKGLGLLLHLTVAKYAYDHFGLILGMSDETSASEKALWQRLRDQGYATPAGYPAIQKSILSGTTLNRVNEFFQNHVDDFKTYKFGFIDGSYY